jgi:hypothetical protein
MKATNKEAEQGMVKTMRLIREEISNEIKDMTYAEERAYIDQLLSLKTIEKLPKAKVKH